MNPRDSEQNLCSPKFMKITLKVKVLLRWHILPWCISLSRCHKEWRFQTQKLPWTRNRKCSTRSKHGIWKKSRAKRWLFFRHKETTTKSTLLHWWTYVTSKIRSWNQNYRSFKAESCSRETIVKDDSGAYAAFAEHGLSASQMTVAKIMDVGTRLQGCDGQAADAVSA